MPKDKNCDFCGPKPTDPAYEKWSNKKLLIAFDYSTKLLVKAFPLVVSIHFIFNQCTQNSLYELFR